MKFDDFEERDKNDADALQNKFEILLKDNASVYFEEDEFDELIIRFSENQKIDLAMKAASLGLAQYPFSTQLMIRQAQLYGVSDQALKAFELLDAAEMFEPGNEEIQVTRGTIFSHIRQSKKAIDCFMKALDMGGEKEEIFILIALEYQNMQRPEDAIRYFRKVLKLAPDNDFAMYEIAWSYDQNGKTEDAVAFFETFLDSHPYSITAWHNLGLARIRTSEYEKAISAFDYALAIQEDFVPAIIYKALAFAGLQKFSEAIEMYKSSFSYQEPDAETYYFIGECYEKLEEMGKAENYFRKAVLKEPEFARAWVGLAVISEFHQRPLEGIHCMRKALEIEDKNPDFWYYLAGFQDEAGLSEEADLSYRHSLMLEPNLWECRLDYSDFLAQHHHLDQAIETLTEGIQIDPGRTSLIYRYGALLLESGSRKSALQVIEQALIQEFDLHQELLDYYPQLEKDAEINLLIDRYRD